MNIPSFAHKAMLAASLCTAFAATGCVAATDSDDVEDSETQENAVTATNASSIMTIAQTLGPKAASALGPLAGPAVTMILASFGIHGTTNLSQASMQEIANLVGTTVRSEFLNTYEAKLNSAYTLSSQYSRSCTTKQGCGGAGTLTTLQSKATDIINLCTEVSEYYKLTSLSKDRLTVAPQLVNALMLNTTFLAETYQLFKLQNPTGNNSAYRQSACNFAKSSVTTMNSVETQFNDYINGRVTPIESHTIPKNFKATCYKLDGNSHCVSNYPSVSSTVYAQKVAALKAERTQKYQAMYNDQRPKILSDNFNTVRTQLTQIGACN